MRNKKALFQCVWGCLDIQFASKEYGVNC